MIPIPDEELTGLRVKELKTVRFGDYIEYRYRNAKNYLYVL